MRLGRALWDPGFQSHDQPMVESVAMRDILSTEGDEILTFGATLSIPIFVTERAAPFPAVSRTVTLAGPVALFINMRAYFMTSAHSFGLTLGTPGDQYCCPLVSRRVDAQAQLLPSLFPG